MLLRLTKACTGPSLLMMSVAKTILVAVAVAALFAYALDCSASVSPEEAIQCCQSMPCSSHGHTGEDCCKTMPGMHAPFVQPSAASKIAPRDLQLAVIATAPQIVCPESLGRHDSTTDHSPPANKAPDLTPLRI